MALTVNIYLRDETVEDIEVLQARWPGLKRSQVIARALKEARERSEED